MLGFAMRAGKVAIGTDTVIASMKAKGAKRARLVLVSSFASEGTKKKLGFKAEYYSVPIRFIDADPALIGDMLGKSFSPMALAILDDRFAEEILKATEPTAAAE